MSEERLDFLDDATRLARINPDEEAARLAAARERAETARLMQEILRNLGALSALTEHGPLRDRVDDETEHMTSLWEALAEAGKPA